MPTPIVSVDQEAIEEDLRELVRRTVEDTLNGLLEEEADDLVGAGRYERPAFDKNTLRELGAANIEIDTEMWKMLWTPDEQRHYRTAPMFMAKAVK